MAASKGLFAGLIVTAGVATWLLLVGPPQALGVDPGNLGIVLLLGATWVSLTALANAPVGDIDASVSPGEWRAWIALGFTAVIAAYSIVHAGVFQGPPLWQNPDANRVGRHIALMVIAWLILSRVLATRWHGRVQSDERDREIESRAGTWARMSLVLFVVAIALMLAFSPTDRLQWAPAPMVAHLIVLALIASSLVEYAVTAGSYWRDRH